MHTDRVKLVNAMITPALGSNTFTPGLLKATVAGQR